MSKRAAAVAETRRRIVEATRELHGEQGIAATSWDDIAARAGVGVGTVYRHFPSLDELIPACGAVTMEVIALPDAATVFAGARSARERIGRLVREVFAIYARGAPQLRAMRRDPDVHPGVAAARDEVEAALDALVAAAGTPDRAVTRAMIDLGTWEAFRAQGLSQEATVEAVTALMT